MHDEKLYYSVDFYPNSNNIKKIGKNFKSCKATNNETKKNNNIPIWGGHWRTLTGRELNYITEGEN